MTMMMLLKTVWAAVSGETIIGATGNRSTKKIIATIACTSP